jgi:hypothetical protein
MAPARLDELRQGQPGQAAHVSTAPVPPASAAFRSGFEPEHADIARLALEHAAAAADGPDVLVHSERSGLARFATSTQHQPTLVDDTVVTLRAVRTGGSASPSRTGRATTASASSRARRCGRPDA